MWWGRCRRVMRRRKGEGGIWMDALGLGLKIVF